MHDTVKQVYVVCHTEKSQMHQMNKSKSFEQRITNYILSALCRSSKTWKEEDSSQKEIYNYF